MSVTVRPLQPNDFQNWNELWIANNMGVDNDDVTSQTWDRLMDESTNVHGFCAICNGEFAGLVHYVLHPTTGHLNHACYMQDLFVAENMRRKGVGSALLKRITEQGQQEKWARLTWLADNASGPAQSFYRKLGAKINFSVYVMMFD